MGIKRHRPEEIVTKLRQVEVLVGQGDKCPEMVVIPPGSFQMGSSDGDDDEKPVHKVTISHEFAVGKYEVTQAQWQALKAFNPSRFKGSNRPVETVALKSILAFISKLNSKTGQTYRLLSEAEWEYVARAGTTTNYSFGNIISRNQADYKSKKTTPVGSYPANRFGVHDMHGNVWEWVEDCYEGDYGNASSIGNAKAGPYRCDHVMRGGAWSSFPWDLRSSDRSGSTFGTSRFSNFGFRVARELQ
jgi:formylglycine-generating enzyme required for sulfatase activity